MVLLVFRLVVIDYSFQEPSPVVFGYCLVAKVGMNEEFAKILQGNGEKT